jgi:hypothetical protein
MQIINNTVRFQAVCCTAGNFHRQLSLMKVQCAAAGWAGTSLFVALLLAAVLLFRMQP